MEEEDIDGWYLIEIQFKIDVHLSNGIEIRFSNPVRCNVYTKCFIIFLQIQKKWVVLRPAFETFFYSLANADSILMAIGMEDLK